MSDFLNTIHGFINGVNASSISLLLTFTYISFKFKRYYVAKSFSVFSITVILFSLSMAYFEKTYSSSSYFKEDMNFLNIAKFTNHIAAISFLYCYYLSFRIIQIQKNYVHVLKAFCIFCVLNFTALMLIEDKRITPILFLSPLIISLLIIAFHANRHLRFVVYGDRIRNSALASTFPLILHSVIIFYFNGEMEASFLLYGQVVLCLAVLVASVMFITYSYEITDYFQKLDKLQAGNILLKLEHAVKNKSFYMQYQPQIQSGSKNIIGYEALIRWDDSIQGSISPAIFIPIAENTKFIDDITKLSFKLSIEKLYELQNISFDGTMSVNMSIKSLTPSMVDFIIKEIEQYNIPANKLVIEVTESTVLVHTEQVQEALKAIREFGFSLSLDDYGTGFSSLSNLETLRPSEIKIDSSFIKDICTNNNHKIIVSSTLEMCRKLKITNVAEGVEDKEVLDLLTEMGCELIQGYFISKPLKSDILISWTQNYDAGYIQSKKHSKLNVTTKNFSRYIHQEAI